MVNNIMRRTQTVAMRVLPKAIIITVIAGIIAVFLTGLINWISTMFTNIGDLGITLITTIIALIVFSFALGMVRDFEIEEDLIPILIVSPLTVALLTALNLASIPVISSTVELGANLGLVIASVIFADGFVRQLGFFK